MVETGAISTDAVDIGGLVDTVAISGDCLGGVIVAHDEEYVRLFVHWQSFNLV